MDLDPDQRRASSDPQDLAAEVSRLSSLARAGLIPLPRLEAAARLGHPAAGRRSWPPSEACSRSSTATRP